MREEVGPSARLDKDYHHGMDILTAAGFAPLNMKYASLCVCVLHVKHTYRFPWFIRACIQPRTQLVSVLRGAPDGFVKWSGIQCSSWVSISRGTTLRSFFAPLGNQDVKCVADGNVMTSRSCLVCLLVMALGGYWVLEQPASSLMFRHPRMQQLCQLAKVRILIYVLDDATWPQLF